MKADIDDSRYSLILDESTYVTTMKFICIRVRCYRPKMKKVLFASLGMVEGPSTTSLILHRELKDFLASCVIPLKNLIGIGTNGVKNM